MNKNKIFKIVVGSVAGVALGGALIYYNFIDKDLAPTLSVGDTAPDFVVDTYDVTDGTFHVGGDTFQLSKQSKLTVINFWDTWCSPCKAELPHFSELQEEYEEYLTVIALVPVKDHKNAVGVENFLNGVNTTETEGWSDFAFTFGYYNVENNNIFYQYGFEVSPTWPSTAIVDENGEVVYLRTGGFATYEELLNDVKPFLPDGTESEPSTPVQLVIQTKKNWWKENALGVTFLAVSTAALGAAIVVSAVTTAKDKKKTK